MYCAVTHDWNYNTKMVDLSMPGYIAGALHKFNHVPPSHKEHALHMWNTSAFGAKVQYAKEPDIALALNTKRKLYLQHVVGTLLNYARAVVPTMLVALGSITKQQAKDTEKTLEAIVKSLNYAAMHPDASICYHASNMVLHINSNISYLSMPEVHGCSDGFFYLSSHSKDPNKAPTQPLPLSRAILVMSNCIRNVVASAAEAEIAALFENGQESTSIHTTLHKMGYTQLPMPM